MPDALSDKQTRLVVVLCAPRSFSSVFVCMLGQHPDIYGFPELDLFVGDTMQDVVRFHRRMPQASLHGLLRALAELNFAGQTEETIEEASNWLCQRESGPAQNVLNHLLEAAPAKIAIDKSPVTAFKKNFLARTVRCPGVRYLHLAREPVAAIRSIQRAFFDVNPHGVRVYMNPVRAARMWSQMTSNICGFLETLPKEQWHRVRGEDVLSDPRRYLREICGWLGLQTNDDAVEAMLKPEKSPFACLGPPNARLGNDIDFLRSPFLRDFDGKESEKSDSKAMEVMALVAPDIPDLARITGYV